MALASQRTVLASPTPALPPVSHAHQQGLRAMVSQLQATGQDVRLLTELAESLPRLRAGLSSADRQRIDDLYASEAALISAISMLQDAIGRFDDLQANAEQPLLLATILVDAALLTQIAEAARALAEAANEVALRAIERSHMLG